MHKIYVIFFLNNFEGEEKKEICYLSNVEQRKNINGLCSNNFDQLANKH